MPSIRPNRVVPFNIKLMAILARQSSLFTFQTVVIMMLLLLWFRQFNADGTLLNLSFWMFCTAVVGSVLLLRFGPIGSDLLALINQGGMVIGECTAIDRAINKQNTPLTFIYEVKGQRYQLQVSSKKSDRFEIDGDYLVLYDIEDPYHAIVPLTFSSKLHNFLLEEVKIEEATRRNAQSHQSITQN